jgi:hypothetical protein
MVNLWFGFRFFLQNTITRWFYHGNDDFSINAALIGSFLDTSNQYIIPSETSPSSGTAYETSYIHSSKAVLKW